MSTSGSVNYNITAEDLITDALRVLGVIEEGGSASTSQKADCLPSFEMYIKGLQVEGLQLWATKSASISLTASDGTYTFSSTGDVTEKALKITDAVLRDTSNVDTTLMPLTREEWWALSDKTTAGFPTQYYYDPQLSSGNFNIWPTPDSTAAGYTIEVTYQRPLEDIDTVTNNIDFPQEWLETIKYGLATRLAPMYGYPVRERQMLYQEYALLLKRVLDFDAEQESIYFQPDRINA